MQRAMGLFDFSRWWSRLRLRRGRHAEALDLSPWRERLAAPLSEEDFSALMAELVQQLPGVREVEVLGPLQLEVRTRRLEHAVTLAVVYADLPDAPDAREAHLRFFLGSTEEALQEDRGKPREVDATRIVPLLWSREALERSPLEHLVHTPFVADLHVVYAVDLPHSFAYLLPEERDALGLDDAALRRTAVENLTRLLPPLTVQGSPTLSILTAGGNYEASLLLVDDVWAQLASTVQGRPLVCAPARDLLYLTGEDTPGGLEALEENVSRIWPQLTRTISRTVLVREGQEWQPLRPFLMQ